MTRTAFLVGFLERSPIGLRRTFGRLGEAVAEKKARCG
jgi:hypothetical protein